MDRHINEESSRTLDIVQRWRIRIAAGNAYELQWPQSISGDRVAQSGKVRIESPVKTHLELDLGLPGNFQNSVDFLKIKAQGFFAKDMFL